MTQILLIEDEQWLGELYARLLVKAGHSVRWCHDGHEAIELIDQQPPQLLVLDLLLPWVNGLQLLHEIASYSDLSHIKIVLCTSALPQYITAQQLRHYGVTAVLHKTTMRPADLVRAVNESTHK